MRASLFRLGADFGNGPADRACFQWDEHTPHALREKARILSEHQQRYAWVQSDEARLLPVLEWMTRRVRNDTGHDVDVDLSNVKSGFDSLARGVAEDFVVMTRHGSKERASLVHVCFPSGWCPKRIVGKGFDAIHAPVAEFDAVRRKSTALVRAMFEKGPFVRFVWTASPSAELDRHPDVRQQGWHDAVSGYLRVERQVTVPFPAIDASLFVIRVHLYPFGELSQEERRRLVTALRETSDAILAYKGLLEHRATILRLLNE